MTFILSKAEEMTKAIDAIVAEECPTAGRRPMYGGIVFELDPGVHKTMICGHFVYQNHVSIEFGDGYKFTDPESVLEGKGKFRRHIKLSSIDEVERKHVRAMIRQAIALRLGNTDR